MNRTTIPIRLLPVLLSLLPLAFSQGCHERPPRAYQGYIEGEYVHLGAPVEGTLLELKVRRGDTVQVGDLLFVLEDEAQRAAVEEAERRLAQALARYENLLKGRRPTEIAALEARVAEHRASLHLWNSEFERRQQLFRDQVISPAELDQVRSQRDAAKAALASATAELETARLGGREDEIQAADAERAASAAAVERARWTLNQKRQSSPVFGTVHDVLYRPGEFVPAGAGVVSLLPPENRKIRFFVPQAVLSRVTPGTPISVLRDGASQPVPATVTYLSTQPEFTPPVIYSRETREKLVFMIEAAPSPEWASSVSPGQPVEVRIEGPPPSE